MTELEAVYARHSVRRYQPVAVPNDKAEALIEKLAALNRESGLSLTFLRDAGDVFGRLMARAMGLASAPSAILCFGPDRPGLEEETGFYGEAAVLLAQQIGLNTCWVGMYNRKSALVVPPKGQRLTLAIAVGLGQDGGKPRNSKKTEQVSAGPDDKPAWFKKGIELSLLAPTAINQQKFLFTLREDGTVELSGQEGPFYRVDLGIVKYHFLLGAREMGASPDVITV